MSLDLISGVLSTAVTESGSEGAEQSSTGLQFSSETTGVPWSAAQQHVGVCLLALLPA